MAIEKKQNSTTKQIDNKNNKKKRYGSLSWRLSIILILSSLPTLIVLYYLVSTSIKDILKNDAYSQLTTVTNLQRQEVYDYKQEAVNDLNGLAGAIKLSGFLNNAKQAELSDLSDRQSGVLELLKQHTISPFVFSELVILDNDNQIILSTSETQSLTARLSDDYWQKTEKDIYIGNVHYLEDEKKHVLPIAVSINQDDSRLGVLVGQVDLNKISLSSEAKGFNTYLVDLDGYLVGDKLSSVQQMKKASLGFASALQRKDGEKEYINHSGRKVFGVYRSLPDLRLSVLSEVKSREVFAPWDNFLNLIIDYSIVILFSTVFLGVLFGLFISSPLKKIVSVSQKITEGDFSKRAIVNSDTEIGALADAFNQMTSKLISLTQSQKKVIEERTSQLKSINKQNSAILFSIGDGVIAIDKDKNIISFNQTAEKISGYASKKIIGKKYVDYVRLYIKDIDNNIFIRVKKDPFIDILKDGKVYKASTADHLYYKHKDDRYTPIRMTATPITEDDKIIGAMAVFTDVTLENEVDNMKSEFISVVSHKLRTPLTSIRWFTEMLLDGEQGKISSGQSDYLRQIFESDERMIILINNLLSVVKLETNKEKLTDKKVSAVELVQKVIGEEKPIIMAKNMKIDLEVLSEDIPDVTVDPLNFKQSVKNLVSNAVKYNKKVGGRVGIKLGRINCKEWQDITSGKKTVPSDKNIDLFKLVYDKISDTGCRIDKDFLFVEVSDTGIGIPEKDQHKIFQKFYRGANVTNLDTDGTGLGLYVVKLFADRVGGSVWFTSKENEGTTFYLATPIKIDN